jgi:hypothetical protein
MVAYKIVPPLPPFDYGSPVRVTVTPNPYRLSQGSVCGFQTIEDPALAEKPDVAVGSVYVIVEDNSGLTVKIPARDLEII